MSKPKITTIPSPAYSEYKPDRATQLAVERARRDQPALVGLSSNVPAYVKGEGWK